MKKTLRNALINHRKSLSKSQIDAINQKFLTQFIDFFDTYHPQYHPKIIAGYVSINNEINVLPSLDYCRQLGFQTALPYCHGKDTPLTFHNFSGDATHLTIDNFKIPAPNPKLPCVIPDLIICPAVGVSNKTHKRLGYGGGFYDRYAHHNPQSHYIAGFCDYQIIDNETLFSDYDIQFFNIFKI